MSYYFYDLETSGLSAKWQRIMQFAGQRTDENFNLIREPDNWFVKLTPEILPEPEAVMITGITPQVTLADGITEPELLQNLAKTVFTRDTTVLGFNSIRFDDEFMRYTLYRNFYDPYEREWSDNRSRWDIVDLVRMTRALRPDGIVWPVSEDGKATNRLEKLSAANGLEHEAAHDALSDVVATIAVAKLIKQKQPKLFNHLLALKDKKKVAKLLEDNKDKPVVHSSSKYRSDNLSTSVVGIVGPHPTNKNAVFAYDLRQSPKQFAELDSEQLAELAFTPFKELEAAGKMRLPVKLIQINKSPALAPIGVLDDASQERINLSLIKVKTHFDELTSMSDFHDKLVMAWETNGFPEESDAEARLYDGFMNDDDKALMRQVVSRDENGLGDWHPAFIDDRLEDLLLRYKAKHFPGALSGDEKQLWEQYRAKRLAGKLEPVGIQAYLNRLEKLKTEVTDKSKLFLLEELKLYAESIGPYDNEQLV